MRWGWRKGGEIERERERERCTLKLPRPPQPQSPDLAHAQSINLCQVVQALLGHAETPQAPCPDRPYTICPVKVVSRKAARGFDIVEPKVVVVSKFAA